MVRLADGFSDTATIVLLISLPVVGCSVSLFLSQGATGEPKAEWFNVRWLL